MYAIPHMSNSFATIAVPRDYVNSEDKTGDLRTALAVEIPLMILALSTVVLRIYSRLAIKKKLATDDVLIILGTAAAIVRTVISCMSADDNGGYDRKGPDHRSQIAYYQHIFERRIAYFFAVTFTRLSILAYYLRIFPPGLANLRRCCHFLILVNCGHRIGLASRGLNVLARRCTAILLRSATALWIA
ncbi:hypothetical protein ACN47E_009289 [Coniothyrium glycines]